MKFNRPEYFNSREVSWVDFNFRVLGEAQDKSNPLIERLRFLGIVQSNQDEFFNIRVASLHEKIANNEPADSAGQLPVDQLQVVLKKSHQLLEEQDRTFKKLIQPQLSRKQIKLRSWAKLSAKQREVFKQTFDEIIFPIVTPLAIDSSRPFPFLRSGTLNIAVQLRKKEGQPEPSHAIIPIPESLERVMPIAGEENQFVLLEDIMLHYLKAWFPNHEIQATTIFRLTRDMDVNINDDTNDLKGEVVKALQKRQRGAVMRIEAKHDTNSHLIDWLLDHYQIDRKALFLTKAPLDMKFVNNWIKQIKGHHDLLFKPFTPYDPPILKQHSVFHNINQSDILVHHPYDSFNEVIELIQQAAEDPKVLSIKMTLYRVSKNSPIIQSLKQAAQNGKEVTVMVELKARFDEANNLHWTNELEAAGCHVIYGLQGLKIHCKLTLIVRREGRKVKRYMHLATGNYNDKTANLYTDMGLFTANEQIGSDATKIFNMLSGAARKPKLEQLVISPNGIRDFLMAKIDQEIKNHQSGRPAYIQMKMNSLSDNEMIEKLYQASAAGVKVDLIIRGICNLKVGIKGVSDNISVHSIVGRLLEHSRVYIFNNNGHPESFLSSADLMTRNLSRRVEILFPVQDNVLNHSVQQIFNWLWKDNIKTRSLNANDEWHHVSHRGVKGFNAQNYLINNRQTIADQRLSATGFIQSKSNHPEFKPLK